MTDRYPSIGDDPRRYRSRKANRTAALLLIGAIVITIALVALLTA